MKTKIKLSSLDLKTAEPGNTAVRVYCAYGYWDGVFMGHAPMSVRNQPGKKQIMVEVMAIKDGLKHIQHPRQCRVVEAVGPIKQFWAVFHADHRFESGPYPSKKAAQEYIWNKGMGFAAFAYAKGFGALDNAGHAEDDSRRKTCTPLAKETQQVRR